MIPVSFTISAVTHFTSDGQLDMLSYNVHAIDSDGIDEVLELESVDDLVRLRNCINTYLKANHYQTPPEP